MKKFLDLILSYKMMKATLHRNKAYSLIVLVIAIIVIIILAGVAISSLRTSRQRTEMMNFIFDMNSMEEKVQSYYAQNGSLPTVDKKNVDIEELSNRITANHQSGLSFKSQLSEYDNENYYYIDVNRLRRNCFKRAIQRH